MNDAAAVSRRRRRRMPRRESGITLLIALIALVALSLGGIALMRMIDGSVLIAGNLGFKQNAGQIADIGTEAAIDWLNANVDQLDSDDAGAGYYATWRAGCDLLGDRTASGDDDVTWNAAGAAQASCGMKAIAVDADRLPTGYSATYIINRMCSSDGSPNDPGVSCPAYTSRSGGSGSTKGGGSYGQLPLSGTAQQFYRVTTRVSGPRNTESFVQAVIGL